MVTIKMIARKCGFSTATVSKALNGLPDVSAETAEYIRKTAAEMGYMPNAAARILKTSRSRNFGVLFENGEHFGISHKFISDIFNGFQHRAEELGYDISFITGRIDGKDVGYVEHARYRHCDGVLVALADYSNHAVLELVSSGIPVVTIDYTFENCGSVSSDNIKGITDLVTYIHHMGHRKIAFAYGSESAVTRQRVASFCRTCKELGLSVPEEYLVPAAFLNPDRAAEVTARLLKLPDPPTCIIYPDDISFIGGIREITKMGLSIPEDISVVGYDGTEFSQMVSPKLTTLKQDTKRMGESAAEELAKAAEEGRAYLPGRIVVPGILLKGETVKKLAP